MDNTAILRCKSITLNAKKDIHSDITAT